MILGATHGQQMGEGRRPQSTSNQPPILGYPEMPPHYKVDINGFKSGDLSGNSACDPLKNNALSNHPHSRVPLPNLPPPSVAATTTPPQPFTTPWLTDVARMTPLSYPSTINSSVAEYYHHYHNLPPRTHFYTSPFISPSPYVRDFPHPRHPVRNLTSVDSRTTDLLRCSTSIAHSLRPTTSISTTPLDIRERYPLDLRDQREILHQREQLPPRPLEVHISPSVHNPSNLSPKDHYGEPNVKKRPVNTLSSGSSSSTSTSYDIPLHSSYPSRIDIPPESSQSPTISTTKAPSPRNQPSTSSFHSHFKRGSLVTVGENVRRVEDLCTSDFIEAANAAEDLELDPSTVGAISSNAEKHASTITFFFPSTNKEIPVEASDDHPFFVFHKGWSSCDPQRTLLKYDLIVRQLMINDVCVSLRKISVPKKSGTQTLHTDMPPPKTPTKTFHSSAIPLTSASATHSSLSFSTSSTLNLSLSSSTVQNISLNLSSSQSRVSSETPKLPQRVSKDDLISLRASNSKTVYSQRSFEEPENAKSSGRKRRWSDPGA